MASPLLRLVVLFGGVSAEHDVSCVTAAHVLAAADRSKYDLVPIGITKGGTWLRNDKAIAALTEGSALPDRLEAAGTEIEPLTAIRGEVDGPDQPVTVVLPLLHGPHGEDGTIQGMLELFKVPYVGAGVLSSALCMDKAMAKVVAEQAGIPQCRWIEFRDGIDDPNTIVARAVDELGLPLFVKPANLGSSVGISKAHDPSELDKAIDIALRYDDVVIIEEHVTAREVEVAVLGNTAPEASVPGEILPGSEFYDYEDKYVTGAATLVIPAELPDDATREVRYLAAKAFTALRCAGMARVDFFYEEGGRGWLLNEVNTIPGFTPGSMYPKLWEATGVRYPDLIDQLVTFALENHRRRVGFSTDH
ncbi:D-alanine--D-alanine ligase family protein [Gordonia sp. ABSL11-1]|uniref:D-alanine--D-alanine ligase family protein n=1 Tax=Gordonia sp. ABSL11-1 TaxID=3053924 RepID=UPI0025742DD6|nr:D-alanine--D-alanine ligase family protein [Gordonia sp. ABSL11-1]MDL9947287.1 D-alanine--D-alanine ligase family protein [Gordonia sp. ABSL11-1]